MSGDGNLHSADTDSGMHRKYYVFRADRRDAPGDKHYGCEYFVLDLTHDPHAVAALRAYADACQDGNAQFAEDLRSKASLREGVVERRAAGQET